MFKLIPSFTNKRSLFLFKLQTKVFPPWESGSKPTANWTRDRVQWWLQICIIFFRVNLKSTGRRLYAADCVSAYVCRRSEKNDCYFRNHPPPFNNRTFVNYIATDSPKFKAKQTATKRKNVFTLLHHGWFLPTSYCAQRRDTKLCNKAVASVCVYSVLAVWRLTDITLLNIMQATLHARHPMTLWIQTVYVLVQPAPLWHNVHNSYSTLNNPGLSSGAG